MSRLITSSSSYEQYMKDQLSLLSKNFTLKTYKRAADEKWDGFEKGKDLRIQIQWKNEKIFEFLVEKSFWYQRNTNKEDRHYMRLWADPKIGMIKGGLIIKKPIPIKTLKSESKIIKSIGHTQDIFEKIKRT